MHVWAFGDKLKIPLHLNVFGRKEEKNHMTTNFFISYFYRNLHLPNISLIIPWGGFGHTWQSGAILGSCDRLEDHTEGRPEVEPG